MTRACIQLMAVVLIGVVSATTAVSNAAAGDAPMPGLTGGDTPWEEAYDEAMLQGRDAYNDGQFQDASEQFTRAIQILPDEPAAYRNLARSYNLDGQLQKAIAYYDHYLELAGDAGDADQIREERSGAIARGGDDPWTTPADQRMARRALQRELDDGHAVTDPDGTGGAWGMYQTLLQLGYAAPDLDRLRGRLAAQIAEEFDERLEPHDGFLPLLGTEDWQLQSERIAALDQLARSEQRLDWLQPRAALVDAAEALHNGEYERAAEFAEAVQQAGDEFAFAGWYRAVALKRGRAAQEALNTVDTLLDEEVFDEEGQRRLVVLRATILQQLGDTEEATEAFESVLRP